MLQKRKPGFLLISALLATFICGTAVGTGATIYYIKSRIVDAIAKGPIGVRNLVIERVVNSMGMTEEQAKLAVPLMTEAHAKVIKVRLQFQPQLDEISRDFDSRFIPILNEEQKKIFFEVQKRWQKQLHPVSPEAAETAAAQTAVPE